MQNALSHSKKFKFWALKNNTQPVFTLQKSLSYLMTNALFWMCVCYTFILKSTWKIAHPLTHLIGTRNDGNFNFYIFLNMHLFIYKTNSFIYGKDCLFLSMICIVKIRILKARSLSLSNDLLY